MKQILNGISYDTEAAEEVSSGDHGHYMSSAGWTLYRKPDGTFWSCPWEWFRSAGSLVILGGSGRIGHAGTADSKTMGLSLTVATDSSVM